MDDMPLAKPMDVGKMLREHSEDGLTNLFSLVAELTDRGHMYAGLGLLVLVLEVAARVGGSVNAYVLLAGVGYWGLVAAILTYLPCEDGPFVPFATEMVERVARLAHKRQAVPPGPAEPRSEDDAWQRSRPTKHSPPCHPKA